MMSARGSSPKMASDNLTEPAFLPSSVVTSSSISLALLRLLAGGRLGFALWRGGLGRSRLGCRLLARSRFRCWLRRCRSLRRLRFSAVLGGVLGRRWRRLFVRFGGRAGFGQFELARLRRAVRQLLLHRIADHDPAAFDAGHGAFDQDQSARDVGLPHFQIERRDAIDAEMAGHFFILEGLTGILAAAGRTMRAVRDRNAVAGAEPGEIPALHRAGPALAGGGAGDVDKLADHEMVGGDFGADRDQALFIDAEFSELSLWLDLGDGKMAAVGLGGALRLAHAGAELQRHVAVLLFGAVADDLAIAEPQYGHWHMFTAFGEQARHADFLCEHSGTHCVLLRGPYSLISTSTPAARSSFMSASTVCGVGSTISSRRLCVRISNCSRLFLSTCGERLTVNFSIRVGRGIGPRTCAPVRLAVLTISLVDVSSTRWSKALSLIRMLVLSMAMIEYSPVLRRYLTILVTTPAPTVRPPSRIAKRSPSSM